MDSPAPPIVVVAYNRPRSLNRVLASLTLADYPSKDITLIISIDRKEDNSDVLEIANSYLWEHGPKEIRYQETNLGLKAHILQCGDISLEYGSVIVLEDDLYVSKNFYSYAIQSLEFTKDDDRIGGISLYNHQLNVHTRDYFNALEDGFDNWYFQFASSWGQVWSNKQWRNFRDWYENNSQLQKRNEIPNYVLNWSDKSWLKFYIAYLVEKDKYFFYPKISLTTNFSDPGTHICKDSTTYQVPLSFENNPDYKFSNLENSLSIYDAFFENVHLPTILGYSKDSICCDLYGHKNHLGEKFYLTSKILNHKVVKSFGRSLKPIEANIIQDIEGNDFYIYDTHLSEKNPRRFDEMRRTLYNIKEINYKKAVFISLRLMKDRFKRIFK